MSKDKSKAERRAASRAGEARRAERLAAEREERKRDIADLQDKLIELGLSYRQAELLMEHLT